MLTFCRQWKSFVFTVKHSLSYPLSPHQQAHRPGKTHLCLRAVPQEALEVKEEGGGAGGGARGLGHLLE